MVKMKPNIDKVTWKTVASIIEWKKKMFLNLIMRRQSTKASIHLYTQRYLREK